MSDASSYRCVICNGCLEESGVVACASCLSENAARVEAVALLLEKVDFPCRFGEFGCKEIVRFGGIADHEAACQFKPVSCFIFPTEACPWRGYSKDIMRHLSEKHPQAVSKACDIVIDFKGKIEKKVAVFSKNGVVTAVCYEFDLEKLEFEYSICYASQHNFQISYEIEVANVHNKDCRFLIKCDKHKAYQAGWLNTKSVLNLSHLLPPLNKDDSILISVRASVDINYAELLKLQCKICCAYITIPIFKKNNALICRFCAEKHNLKPVEDNYLESRITELSYPCRWKHCTALLKYDEIRQHENMCSYRKILCPEWNCRETFAIQDVHHHFQMMHNNYAHISSKDTTIFWYHLRRCPPKNRFYYVVEADDVLVLRYDMTKSEFLYDIMPHAKANRISTFWVSTCCKRNERAVPNTRINIRDLFRCCVHTPFPLEGKISFSITIESLPKKETPSTVPIKVLYRD